jgi:hypothetical protein
LQQLLQSLLLLAQEQAWQQQDLLGLLLLQVLLLQVLLLQVLLLVLLLVMTMTTTKSFS